MRMKSRCNIRLERTQWATVFGDAHMIKMFVCVSPLGCVHMHVHTAGSFKEISEWV